MFPGARSADLSSVPASRKPGFRLTDVGVTGTLGKSLYVLSLKLCTCERGRPSPTRQAGSEDRPK